MAHPFWRFPECRRVAGTEWFTRKQVPARSPNASLVLDTPHQPRNSSETIPALGNPQRPPASRITEPPGDAVVWLGADFSDLVERGHPDAVELAEILGMRPMEHLFAAEDRRDWDDWINFFSRTSGSATKKGLIEVLL